MNRIDGSQHMVFELLQISNFTYKLTKMGHGEI